MGYFSYDLIDVHGAGAQRSNHKTDGGTDLPQAYDRNFYSHINLEKCYA